MKKNFLFGLLALVGLLSSCSKDEADLPPTNESNRVSITASLPADFAKVQAKTRALPTANSHTLRCILEVYSEDGATLKLRQETTTATNDNFVFDFEIAQGTYQCLFWADFIATDAGTTNVTTPNTYKHYADKYYTTNDATNGLKAVSIITNNYAFNTDARDAFFGTFTLEKGAAAIENPTIDALTRPFAKLTIKEKDDTKYADCSGMTATYSVPTKFNVSTGAVGATNPAEVTCIEKSTEPTGNVLFSDYIFTDATSTLGEIAMIFASASGKTYQAVSIPAGIPLKRNYKTNASGTLISEKPASTNGVKMTVGISDKWTTPDEEKDLDAFWDGTSPVSADDAKAIMTTAMTTDGSGTARDYVFTITTARQLAALVYLTNKGVKLTDEQGYSGTGRYSSAKYLLAADIDLADKAWTPIGNNDGKFYGTFDGQGHTVSNMNVDITATSGTAYAGFFGEAVNNGTIIQNLIVEGNVSVSTTESCYAGGICGDAYYAIVRFCRFNGTVSGTTTGSSATIYVGGIAGEAVVNSAVSACISNAIVTRSGGSESHSGAGGLLGYLYNDTDDTSTCLNSAWNSDGTTGTTAGIGKIRSGSISDTNSSFTTVSGLNGKLNTINSSVSDRAYEWQANGTSYPKLVEKTN